MQSKQSHHKNGITGCEQGARKQPGSASTVHCNADERRARTPSQTQTCVCRTNPLPSKFEKVPCRPLPPLQGAVLKVQRNDSRLSFKPAKLSDYGSQSSHPVKGRHVLSVPTHNAGVSLTKVHTIADREMLCTESKHTAYVDSPKNTSKNNKLPTRIQRSCSANRLSSSSSGSSSARSSKSSYCPSESSDTRQSRPATPRNTNKHAEVEKCTQIVMSGHNSNEIYSADNKSQRTVPQISRQRSSSVSSLNRVSLQETNQIQTSTPASLGKDIRVTDTDVSGVPEGNQRHRFGVEKSSKALDRDGKAKSQNYDKQTPSDDQYIQSIEHNAPLHSGTLEQDRTVDHLHEQKPLEKDSSNHGILGGKSDDEVSEPMKSSVSAEWMGSVSESRQNSVVCTDYLFSPLGKLAGGLSIFFITFSSLFC